MPPKRARVEEQVEVNEILQDFNGTIEELEKTRKELDQVSKTMLTVEEDRDMCKKLFEDCTKKQSQEIERLRQEYKERKERLALTTAVEKVIPEKNVLRGQSPMELLTPRELNQKTELRPPTTSWRVTIPDQSDSLGDPVVKQAVRKLIETAGRLVAYRNAPGVTAPYGRIDDKGRVEISREMTKKTQTESVTLPVKTSRAPERKLREIPMKKVSRVFDVQKNNLVKNNFTGFPDVGPRACFNQSTWIPAVNMQQPPLGTSHLILGDSLVRVLKIMRTSRITKLMAFGGATTSQLFRMVELMKPWRIPNIMILIGTNNVSRGSDEEEAH